MGFIATDTNKIILYYDSNSSLGEQTYAYVVTSEKELLAIDISKTNVPGSHWAEMADKLKVNISELIAKDHPNFTSEYGEGPVDLDENDWLKLLDKSPEVLAHPIVFIGNRCLQVKTPSQIEQFIASDSQGISK